MAVSNSIGLKKDQNETKNGLFLRKHLLITNRYLRLETSRILKILLGNFSFSYVFRLLKNLDNRGGYELDNN